MITCPARMEILVPFSPHHPAVGWLQATVLSSLYRAGCVAGKGQWGRMSGVWAAASRKWQDRVLVLKSPVFSSVVLAWLTSIAATGLEIPGSRVSLPSLKPECTPAARWRHAVVGDAQSQLASCACQEPCRKTQCPMQFHLWDLSC